MTVADDKSTDESCPAVSTVGDGDNYLDPGESITCTATYTVTSEDVTSGSVTNTASATAGGVTSNTDSKTVTTPRADLSITKSSTPNPYVPGAGFTYTITVTNSGLSDVVNARVQDALPAAISGFGWTCTPNGAGASCGTDKRYGQHRRVGNPACGHATTPFSPLPEPCLPKLRALS